MSPAFRIVVSSSFLLAAAMAQAQTYPSKPIRLVVPFPPGGAVDTTARLISSSVSASLGQPIIVENRPGAGGGIAEEFVSRAAPDGYTILYSVGSDMTTRKFLKKTPSLDPLKDFTPVATAASSVNCVVAGPASAAHSMKELVELVRRNPGKLTYGSSGISSFHHLMGEMLKQHGVDMVHVPYKGLAPAVTALVGGEIDVVLTNCGLAAPHVKDGRARMLAVLEPQRYAGAPDIPTVGEALPGFTPPLSWFGFFGPAELPQPIVAKLNGEIGRALASPEVNGKLRALYLNVIVTPPEQLRGFIASTSESFGQIVKGAGIQPVD
jgi:tripartite-type tricarboxylate transporter receptor subunit TctC